MTLKEQAFITETAKTLNPTKAVEKVYNIGSKGGSKTKAQASNTASVIAKENLTKPHIKKAMDSIVNQLEIERQRAISKLKTKISDAKYRDLNDGIDKLTKNIQLLSGKPTDRQELNLIDDDQKERIAQEILNRNKNNENSVE